jgi:hypothetical protein
MTKRNCWEFKKCGREDGGARVEELGVCLASTETRLNGVHDGTNGGRACWVLEGTLCEGKVQGSFATIILSSLRKGRLSCSRGTY